MEKKKWRKCEEEIDATAVRRALKRTKRFPE
jgi:hypothetical protein